MRRGIGGRRKGGGEAGPQVMLQSSGGEGQCRASWRFSRANLAFLIPEANQIHRSMPAYFVGQFSSVFRMYVDNAEIAASYLIPFAKLYISKTNDSLLFLNASYIAL